MYEIPLSLLNLRCRSTYNCRVQPAPEGQTAPARPGRILAIDYGSRRMGLAVSDALGITAQGLETLQRKNRRSDFARLERVIRENQVQEIVLGYPLRMSGQEGTQSQKVAEFAEELRRKFGLPVHLWDERLTSAEANRLLREADLSIQKRAQAVDRMAATLILQSFMQARSVY
jgi:putative holliday junction resolvase